MKRRLTRRFARGRLTSANPLGDYEWNELPGGQGEEFNRGLVSLIAIGPDSALTALGSGFIVRAEGHRAYGITAAHVLWDAAHKAQVPNPRAHTSTPHFFQANFEAVFVGPRQLRAVYSDCINTIMPSITFVVWDKIADVALFTIESDADEVSILKMDTHFPVTDELPRIGQRVGVMGFADMAVENARLEDGVRHFQHGRRLCLRVGRVRAVHLDGHLLCRGPCIETSIPVFPGMSGGVAFHVPKPGGKLRAFGLVSGDPDEPLSLKRHRWHRGASIMARLPIANLQTVGAGTQVEFRIDEAIFGKQASP